MAAPPPAELAESGQCPGLLLFVAGLTSKGERGVEEDTGLARLAGGEQGFPGGVERFGFNIAITVLPEDFQRSLVIADRVLTAAPPALDPAEPGQGPGFDPPAADLPRQRERLGLVAGGFLIAALPLPDLAEVGQGDGLAELVTDLAVQPDRLTHMPRGLLVTTLPQIDKAKVGQGNGL